MIQPNLIAVNTQIDTLPPLPAIITKVMAVTANPESNANDLMEVILPDQSICSTILKVANSAFFGIPREVSSIERAVVVLGFEEIRNIVIGKAIFSAFPKMSKEQRLTVGLFWEHALTCGIAAKIIGSTFRMSASELFIAGLIHDIGKLALLLTFPNDYLLLREISSPGRLDSTSEEVSDYSISHDQVGLKLAKQWLLPEKLTMAIGYHHSPEKATSDVQYPLVIQVADILSLMYSSSDILIGEDVIKIFDDFLPDTKTLWSANGMELQPENLSRWFNELEKSREENQGILNILAS
jgi:HD-like signal output (HDOD) protein